MFFLTSSFFLVEIVVGHLTNSMALVADSFHMLSDIAALIIAFISVRMSPKSWDKNTYGWARAEVLGKKSPFNQRASSYNDVTKKFFHPLLSLSQYLCGRELLSYNH